jgi:hypothetical protein
VCADTKDVENLAISMVRILGLHPPLSYLVVPKHKFRNSSRAHRFLRIILYDDYFIPTGATSAKIDMIYPILNLKCRLTKGISSDKMPWHFTRIF